MLARDTPNQKEAEAGSLDAEHGTSGNAIEAVKDALVLVGRQPQAGVGDAQRCPGVVRDGEGTTHVDSLRGVFDGVIKQIENGGAQVFGNSHDAKANASRDGFEDDRIWSKMVALQSDLDALGDERLEIDKGSALQAMALPELARFEDLLDSGKQAVGIGKHGGVELLALSFLYRVALKRFEVESDAGNRRLELVGDRVQEGILTFVAAYLAHQKDRIENDTGDKQGEEDDPQDGERNGALIENDPSDLQGDGKADKKDTEGDKECNRSAASCDVHGLPGKFR